jgi:HEPN domain-containing protein
MFEADDEVLHIVRQWVQKAENDLRAAVQTLKLRAHCPTDTVCFHAEQVVEKYLKTLLVWHRVDFPKTHNLGILFGLLPASLRPELTA